MRRFAINGSLLRFERGSGGVTGFDSTARRHSGLASDVMFL